MSASDAVPSSMGVRKGDVMARHRLANGGRGATPEQTERGPFSEAARLASTGAPAGRRPNLEPRLGLASTKAMLEELKSRGDVALVAYPGTELASDGSILRALAEAAVRALGKETLNYSTVELPEGTVQAALEQRLEDLLGGAIENLTTRTLLNELRARAEAWAGHAGSGYLADRVDDMLMGSINENLLDGKREP